MADTPAAHDRGRSGPLESLLSAALSRAVRSQRSAATAYVRKLREAHPAATPVEIRAQLDSRFLTAVTVSGTAVGAAGAVPGLGTVAALGAVGAESVLFLEVSALYTMAVAKVHGVDIEDDAHREALVMTVLLGASGTALLSTAVGASGTRAAGGSLAGSALRIPSVRELNSRLLGRLVRRYATKRAALVVGKLAPAGIGAAIGGWGNRRLGRTMVDTAHATFGAPPSTWS